MAIFKTVGKAQEYQTYKQKYGDRKKFHRNLGLQQIAARKHVIWILLAHQGNSMVMPGVPLV